MPSKIKTVISIVLLSLVIGCAGMQRGCSGFAAESFGADWIVVQYDMNMQPKCCWKLTNTSITNETNSDGIYWVDSRTGHLVHISGWYNRVQVKDRDFEAAAKLVNVDLSLIQNGIYPASK
jgi:hypothetical protein